MGEPEDGHPDPPSTKLSWGSAATAPAKRRIADVSRLPFAEGEARGGQILYDEPEKKRLRRQRAPFTALIQGCGLVAGLAALVFVLLHSSGAGLVAVSGGAAAVLALLGMRRAERKDWGTVKPIRIYANGISLGAHDGPYLSFGDLYSVEEQAAQKYGTLLLLLTFVDGTEVVISRVWFGSGNVWVQKDYDKVRALFTRKFAEEVYPRSAWTREALEFVTTIPYTKGPTRVQTESLARERNVKVIDLEFIRTNWRTIGEHNGLGMNTFNYAAMEAFESKVEGGK